MKTFPEQWLHDLLHQATGAIPYPAHRSDLLPSLPAVGYLRTETEREHTLGPVPTPITMAIFDVDIRAESYIEVKEMADDIRLAIDAEARANFSGAYQVAKIVHARITAEVDGEAEYIEGRSEPAAYVVSLTVETHFEET